VTGAAEARIATVRRALAARFRTALIESPELDARVIVGHALGLDHAGLVRESERSLAGAETNAIEALTMRRLAGAW
jgi:release factor glutamine methyltransferase